MTILSCVPVIGHREQLGDVLNAYGLLGTGAEIGVGYGAFAAAVLERWRGERYLAVDPWAPQSAEVYREAQTIHYENGWRECSAMAERDPRLRLMRMLSVEAARDVDDGSLDWVYIDGNHDRAPVLADMDAWWPKVRVGGIFAGHDFYNKTDDGHCCHVQDAVEWWMRERVVPFHVTACSSWWSRKP